MFHDDEFEALMADKLERTLERAREARRAAEDRMRERRATAMKTPSASRSAAGTTESEAASRKNYMAPKVVGDRGGEECMPEPESETDVDEESRKKLTDDLDLTPRRSSPRSLGGTRDPDADSIFNISGDGLLPDGGKRTTERLRSAVESAVSGGPNDGTVPVKQRAGSQEPAAVPVACNDFADAPPLPSKPGLPKFFVDAKGLLTTSHTFVFANDPPESGVASSAEEVSASGASATATDPMVTQNVTSDEPTLLTRRSTELLEVPTHATDHEGNILVEFRHDDDVSVSITPPSSDSHREVLEASTINMQSMFSTPRVSTARTSQNAPADGARGTKSTSASHQHEPRMRRSASADTKLGFSHGANRVPSTLLSARMRERAKRTRGYAAHLHDKHAELLEKRKQARARAEAEEMAKLESERNARPKPRSPSALQAVVTRLYDEALEKRRERMDKARREHRDKQEQEQKASCETLRAETERLYRQVRRGVLQEQCPPVADEGVIAKNAEADPDTSGRDLTGQARLDFLAAQHHHRRQQRELTRVARARKMVEDRQLRLHLRNKKYLLAKGEDHDVKPPSAPLTRTVEEQQTWIVINHAEHQRVMMERDAERLAQQEKQYQEEMGVMLERTEAARKQTSPEALEEHLTDLYEQAFDRQERRQADAEAQQQREEKAYADGQAALLEGIARNEREGLGRVERRPPAHEVFDNLFQHADRRRRDFEQAAKEAEKEDMKRFNREADGIREEVLAKYKKWTAGKKIEKFRKQFPSRWARLQATTDDILAKFESDKAERRRNKRSGERGGSKRASSLISVLPDGVARWRAKKREYERGPEAFAATAAGKTTSPGGRRSASPQHLQMLHDDGEAKTLRRVQVVLARDLLTDRLLKTAREQVRTGRSPTVGDHLRGDNHLRRKLDTLESAAAESAFVHEQIRELKREVAEREAEEWQLSPQLLGVGGKPKGKAARSEGENANVGDVEEGAEEDDDDIPSRGDAVRASRPQQVRQFQQARPAAWNSSTRSARRDPLSDRDLVEHILQQEPDFCKETHANFLTEFAQTGACYWKAFSPPRRSGGEDDDEDDLNDVGAQTASGERGQRRKLAEVKRRMGTEELRDLLEELHKRHAKLQDSIPYLASNYNRAAEEAEQAIGSSTGSKVALKVKLTRAEEVLNGTAKRVTAGGVGQQAQISERLQRQMEAAAAAEKARRERSNSALFNTGMTEDRGDAAESVAAKQAKPKLRGGARATERSGAPRPFLFAPDGADSVLVPDEAPADRSPAFRRGRRRGEGSQAPPSSTAPPNPSRRNQLLSQSYRKNLNTELVSGRSEASGRSSDRGAHMIAFASHKYPRNGFGSPVAENAKTSLTGGVRARTLLTASRTASYENLRESSASSRGSAAKASMRANNSFWQEQYAEGGSPALMPAGARGEAQARLKAKDKALSSLRFEQQQRQTAARLVSKLKVLGKVDDESEDLPSGAEGGLTAEEILLRSMAAEELEDEDSRTVLASAIAQTQRKKRKLARRLEDRQPLVVPRRAVFDPRTQLRLRDLKAGAREKAEVVFGAGAKPTAVFRRINEHGDPMMERALRETTLMIVRSVEAALPSLASDDAGGQRRAAGRAGKGSALPPQQRSPSHASLSQTLFASLQESSGEKTEAQPGPPISRAPAAGLKSGSAQSRKVLVYPLDRAFAEVGHSMGKMLSVSRLVLPPSPDMQEAMSTARLLPAQQFGDARTCVVDQPLDNSHPSRSGRDPQKIQNTLALLAHKGGNKDGRGMDLSRVVRDVVEACLEGKAAIWAQGDHDPDRSTRSLHISQTVLEAVLADALDDFLGTAPANVSNGSSADENKTHSARYHDSRHTQPHEDVTSSRSQATDANSAARVTTGTRIYDKKELDFATLLFYCRQVLSLVTRERQQTLQRARERLAQEQIPVEMRNLLREMRAASMYAGSGVNRSMNVGNKSMTMTRSRSVIVRPTVAHPTLVGTDRDVALGYLKRFLKQKAQHAQHHYEHGQMQAAKERPSAQPKPRRMRSRSPHQSGENHFTDHSSGSKDSSASPHAKTTSKQWSTPRSTGHSPRSPSKGSDAQLHGRRKWQPVTHADGARGLDHNRKTVSLSPRNVSSPRLLRAEKKAVATPSVVDVHELFCKPETDIRQHHRRGKLAANAPRPGHDFAPEQRPPDAAAAAAGPRATSGSAATRTPGDATVDGSREFISFNEDQVEDDHEDEHSADRRHTIPLGAITESMASFGQRAASRAAKSSVYNSLLDENPELGAPSSKVEDESPAVEEEIPREDEDEKSPLAGEELLDSSTEDNADKEESIEPRTSKSKNRVSFHNEVETHPLLPPDAAVRDSGDEKRVPEQEVASEGEHRQEVDSAAGVVVDTAATVAEANPDGLSVAEPDDEKSASAAATSSPAGGAAPSASLSRGDALAEDDLLDVQPPDPPGEEIDRSAVDAEHEQESALLSASADSMLEHAEELTAIEESGGKDIRETSEPVE